MGSDDRPQQPKDLVHHVVRFCRSLREHGLLLGPSEIADAAEGLRTVDLMNPDQVYWAFRSVLVSRPEEVPAFDECFRRYWSFHLTGIPTSKGRKQPATGTPRYSLQQSKYVPDDGQLDPKLPPTLHVLRSGANPQEVSAHRDLSLLKGDELAEVSIVAKKIARALPSRPGRRLRRHKRKGVPDLRGAFRLNLNHGGDLLLLPRRHRVPRVPRLLVLLDVSGSMDHYAKLLLQLLYALGHRAGRIETFVFSTSLTRVTRQLRVNSFSEALKQIGDVVTHWSGGTRIGESLSSLNHHQSHILDSNTSVVILSDGWETGDPEDLASEMSKLRRKVRRIVWLNPLMGTPEFQPLTQGLRAVRPWVDLFASVQDLAQLKRLPKLLHG